jgi:hypothetical protein
MQCGYHDKKVCPMKHLHISSFCRIQPGSVIINAEQTLQESVTSLPEFIRLAYKAAGMAYPKFYKMDDLCKLALVAAEPLVENGAAVERNGKDLIGLVVQNSSSTYDTDTTFQHSIDDRDQYFPSPAVFVYTLPNIMLGEICIKHKIFGENALLITEKFDAAALVTHTQILFEQGRIQACIGGYIEQKKDYYDAFLFLAEAGETLHNFGSFDPETLSRLYNRPC